MKLLILVSMSFVSALLFLAFPASADDDEEGGGGVVFRSRMICDTDGAAPFTDKVGTAFILNNGDLAINIRGLIPSTEYTCLIACNVGAKVVTAPCSTNGKGRLVVLLPGLGRSSLAGLASGCGQPVVTAFVNDPSDDGDFCESGYGEP